MDDHLFLGISHRDWRIIGISLSILSLGLTIAWLGLIHFTQKNQSTQTVHPSSTPTPKNIHK